MWPREEGLKTIGLIGGMSWKSTIPYYQIINETVQARLGGLHSAKVVLHSVEQAVDLPLLHAVRAAERALAPVRP